jgi:hypothetical protein
MLLKNNRWIYIGIIWETAANISTGAARGTRASPFNSPRLFRSAAKWTSQPANTSETKPTWNTEDARSAPVVMQIFLSPLWNVQIHVLKFVLVNKVTLIPGLQRRTRFWREDLKVTLISSCLSSASTRQFYSVPFCPITILTVLNYSRLY